MNKEDIEELKKDPEKLNLLANMIYYTPVSLNAAASDLLTDFEDGLTERGLYRHEIKKRTQLHFKQLERCYRIANAHFKQYSTEHLTKVGARFCREISPDLRKMENAISLQLGRILPNDVDKFALTKAWTIGFISYLSLRATQAIIRLFANLTGHRTDFAEKTLLPDTCCLDVYHSADALQKATVRLYGKTPINADDIQPEDMERGMSVIINRIADPAFMLRIINDED